MNAIEVLKEDHRKIKMLFAEYDSTAGDKRETAQEILREIEIHTRAEENVFYPAVRAHSDKRGKGLLKHSFEDHQLVKDLIRELRKTEITDPDFDDKFEELVETVESHIDFEESETLRLAATILGATYLDDLGREILEEREALTLP